ncbi:hypothetical protein CASFOL_038321 [Castilleja foliolosa]|uniref:PI-PLC Y-box domain-containing protein n=1 Tax=Castilleja foliolosa TaxID=1961234 RepID=A0ABD3BKM5_9LAMI
MHPNFNPHPYNHTNQLNINATNASTPQHVIGSQGNLGPNQMQNRPQFQMQNRPQFQAGLLNNHQLAAPPFTNPNAFFAATQFFPFLQGPLQTINPNNSPQLFAHNAVNQSMPNGQLNISNLGQNVNQLLQMQNNLPQLFANNAVNQPQSMPNGQPQSMPNGQLNMPNFGQNVNQLLQMQMANFGSQNLGPFMNLGMFQANGNGIVPHQANGYGIIPLNHSAAVAQGFGSPQTQGNHISFPPGAAQSQANAGTVNMDGDGRNSWRKSNNKNTNGNQNNGSSQRGKFNKNQYNHRQNAQGNFQLNNQNEWKVNNNNGVTNLFSSNHVEQTQPGKKSSLVLNYTEQEIRQWREARRKNHPSNANTMKKSNENPTQSELMDQAAKLRRQQLKEILAKQAELGCEVAEVPSYYLSDSELHTDCRQQYNKGFGKRGNFRSNFDRKSKFHQFDRFSSRPNNRDRFNKKQRLSNGCCTSDNRTDNNKREPSLLKKLLSSDIKRDKRHLLQVFRFMVTNSFFDNQPEESLKFPHVIVKEPGDESEILETEPQVVVAGNEAYGVAEDGEIPQEVEGIMV